MAFAINEEAEVAHCAVIVAAKETAKGCALRSSPLGIRGAYQPRKYIELPAKVNKLAVGVPSWRQSWLQQAVSYPHHLHRKQWNVGRLKGASRSLPPLQFRRWSMPMRGKRSVTLLAPVFLRHPSA